MKEQAIRKPAVAGMFYSGNESALRKDVRSLLQKATPEPPLGSIIGLIAPHAGYVYSGLTAAFGYKLLQGAEYDCVIIVAPSHREYFRGISVYSGKAYSTPVGTFPVHDDLRNELLQSYSMVEASPRGHGAEHAIEVQLPFLAETLGEVSILPVVMGDQDREFCSELADTLADVVSGMRCLLIASTDLSHYYPGDTAKLLDRRAIETIERFDYESLMTHLEENTIEACGGGPTVAVLSAAKQLGATDVQLLHHCNSGDITGDYSSVVGYLSAAIVKTA